MGARIDRHTIDSALRVSRPYHTPPGGYPAVSYSIWPYRTPPGGYPFRMILRPCGISKTIDRLDPHPVGYIGLIGYER